MARFFASARLVRQCSRRRNSRLRSRCYLTELFHWHPLLMVASWLLLLPFASFYVLQPLPNFSRRRTCHIYLQIAGSCLAIAGFAVMYYKKGLVLTSFHSCFGFLALLVLLLQSLSGLRLSSFLPRTVSFGFSLKTQKLIHHYVAALCLGLGFLTMLTALYTNWFVTQVASNTQWWFCAIGIVFEVIGVTLMFVAPARKQRHLEWAFSHS